LLTFSSSFPIKEEKKVRIQSPTLGSGIKKETPHGSGIKKESHSGNRKEKRISKVKLLKEYKSGS
jgi:hypothetical protein